MVTYCESITVDRVPPEWESCLLDGIIGFYGKFFDQSGMLGDASEFVPRFMAGIKASRTEHFDSESFERQTIHDITRTGLTNFKAYIETNTPKPEQGIIKPAYADAPGKVQILADAANIQDNQRGTPFAQIPGDQQ